MPAKQPPRRLVRPQEKFPEVHPPTIALPVSIERFRVLFADGALVDFLTSRDTSDIRAQMLDAHYGKRPQTQKHNDPTYRIEGIAYLGTEYIHTPTELPS